MRKEKHFSSSVCKLLRKTGLKGIVEPRILQGIILLNQYPCIYITFQCVAALIKAVLRSYRIVDFWFVLLVKTWPQGYHDPVIHVRAARGPA